MPISLDDTIAAVAAASGAAERGIIRISGPATGQILQAVFQPTAGDHAWLTCRIPRRHTGAFDAGTVLPAVPGQLMWWPNRRSYTGQPVAELHVPGAPSVLDALLQSVCRHGARPAERGEFTMRAFLAGRIDLLQAEAVLGVIDATDHAELQQALSQLGGSITMRLNGLQRQLIALLGDLEAGLDFVEEDIEFVSSEQMLNRLEECRAVITQLLDTADERLPSGFRYRVVLAGLPNAGKSTLFNAIARQERALVSPTAGTTRDYLSAVIDLNGVPVELIDTAGWEADRDAISGRAQQQRHEQIEKADLLVWCRAADLSPEDNAADETLRVEVLPRARSLLCVQTCADRTRDSGADTDTLRVSALAGTNLDALLSTIESTLQNRTSSRNELLGSTSARCRESLKRAAVSLRAADSAVRDGAGDEITAMELRQALREIAVVLGEVYTDDILDHIFSSFCIGK